MWQNVRLPMSYKVIFDIASSTLNGLPTEDRSTCQRGWFPHQAKSKRETKSKVPRKAGHFCGWVVAPEHPGTSTIEQLKSAKYSKYIEQSQKKCWKKGNSIPMGSVLFISIFTLR